MTVALAAIATKNFHYGPMLRIALQHPCGSEISQREAYASRRAKALDERASFRLLTVATVCAILGVCGSRTAAQAPNEWSAYTPLGTSPAHRLVHDPSLVVLHDTLYIAANLLPASTRDSLVEPTLLISRFPGAPISAPSGPFQFVHPKLIVDARGRVHMFWAELRSPARTALEWEREPTTLFHSVLSGSAWSTAERVVEGKYLLWAEQRQLIAADPGGRLHVVVPVSTDGGPESLSYFRLDSGIWTRRDFLNPAAYPSVLAVDERLVIAFVGLSILPAGEHRDHEEHDALLLTQSADHGESWSAVQIVDKSDTGRAGAPRLVSSAGHVDLIWAMRPLDGFQLKSLRYIRNIGATVDRDSAISRQLPADVVGYDVAVAPCGDVTAILQTFAPPHLGLEAVTLPEGPTPGVNLGQGLALAREAAVTVVGGRFEVVFSAIQPGERQFTVVHRTRATCQP